MERSGGGGSGGPTEGPRRYITTITLVNEADRIEELTDKVDHVRQCANSEGFAVLDATTSLARERDAVEEFNWGSDKPYRNNNRLHEMQELGMEVGAGAGL